MKYNFDTVVPREDTFCEKYDQRQRIFGRSDVIPMWVADMDFASPAPVLEAIARRLQHPILGYSYRSDSYWQSIVEWVDRRNGWKIDPSWLEFVPGVVPGLVLALRAFTQPGDGVVIQPPVYHPFARQTRLNDRVVINNPVRLVGNRYEIDFEDLDHKLAGAKVFLMSNPHNPTGRVFTREELIRIGELCVKHDVLILADEIHSDLIYQPHKHIHIASLDERFAARTLTFIAPSKTFNLAGLSTASVIIPNATLLRQFRYEISKLHADQGSIFGTIALEAAYHYGEEWLDELLGYLKGNIDYVLTFLQEKMPSVRAVRPEGTYLMWIDFSAWPMSHEELTRFMIEKAGLGLNEGSMFGEEGRGWMRMNIATRRDVVRQAMTQLYEAAQKAGVPL